ncbi:hypothetical protein [Acinetobacter indicus]|uniref:hypothetical protein n=1 Tax=Acinetobacter indicus TaxID=756892 RepID=UPI000CECDF18|nr:hypothetical protein [Acinetobacter indicus]MDM1244015.1 hypothetical protein [Acinetobacter indicus]MDM1288068.1 hypothetical protein [Acinetobacter indicus]
MSYKHNNLLAMRQNYWNDNDSPRVLQEKQFLQQVLVEHDIFQDATLDDAKYLFFNLPSIIIVKGYAHGFLHESVQSLILKYIDENKQMLQQKSTLKIKFRM